MAQLRAEGQAEFDRLQRMGQNMATTMMGHAQRKAAERAAILDEVEAVRGLSSRARRSGKRIEESSAYLVQIEVPKALKITPARAVGHERPQAATTWTGDAPGPWQLGGLIHFDPLFLAAGFFTAATSAGFWAFICKRSAASSSRWTLA